MNILIDDSLVIEYERELIAWLLKTGEQWKIGSTFRTSIPI